MPVESQRLKLPDCGHSLARQALQGLNSPVNLQRLKLPARAAIWLAELYQAILSPLLGGQCRFEPSCSNYFIEAVRTKGLLPGGMMGLGRLIRCNPLCRGGYDPVNKNNRLY